MPIPTYIRQLKDERYEYGIIKIERSNRLLDMQIPIGVRDTFDDAQRSLSKAIEDLTAGRHE